MFITDHTKISEFWRIEVIIDYRFGNIEWKNEIHFLNIFNRSFAG